MTQLAQHSLWLMPSGELLTKLTKIIEELSRDQPTLRFGPHVTLLGGLAGSQSSLSSKTRQLASCVEPYEIQLGKIAYLDEFFRSLFIRVTPTRPVLEANRKASLIFQRHHEPEYLLHLSLMYGEFSSAAKEQIIARLGSEIQGRFKVRAIHLYLTAGHPSDWHRVREFPLESGD
jgi:2'-5' RNA ligase